MKHEVTTLNTKKAFVTSLKKMMEKKPLSKITVSEIVADCGVNRKTFYYHFEDIYALLKWMLEQEAIEVVRHFDWMLNFEEAVVFIMDYVDANKHILNCAYDSMGRDELKRFFFADFIGIMRSMIDDAEKGLDRQVDEDYKNFLCSFYAEAVAGILISEITNRAHGDRERTIKYLVKIYKATLPHVLLSALEADDPPAVG